MPLDSAKADGTAPYMLASPTLLAAQPLTAPPQTEAKEWEALFNHVERRMAGLRSWRWTWLWTWQQLGTFFLPRRSKAWQGQITANLYNRGSYLNDAIIDSTGCLAATTCASGMWSGLTNPARPWFGFAPAISNTELDEAGKEWLEKAAAQVLAVLARSNFYSTMAQFFQDVTVFGTSPVIIYEDDADVIRCYLPCVGEYFLAAGSRLSVDTLYREFTLTVIQIVEMFSLTNCPDEVRQLFATGGASLDQEFVVAHAIEPNFAVSGNRGRGKKITVVPGRFAFREVYWLRGRKSQRPLSLRGFHDQPFMAGRWSVVSNDPYGRGPGMDALGDQKQVQTETLRKAEFIEKLVRPPMTAPPEMKNEPASIMPGMVTFVNTANGKAAFQPAFQVNAQALMPLTADIEKVSSRIKDCFYVPQFLAITQMAGVQPRNELELTKRDLERLQVLGPVIDLFESDVAGPMLQRVVSIMQRRGLLPPLPPSLQAIPLKIQYQSLMRLAQRSAESVAMKDGFATMGTLSEAAKSAGLPDPMRTVNLDKSLQHYLMLNSYPPSCTYSNDEVKQHDQIRMEETQRAKQEAMASQVSKPAVDAAKVLASTPVAGGSYLNQMLSGSTTPG